jgi:hypothetical protein
MSSIRLLLVIAVAAVMLIAPVMAVKLALARPPLAAAARVYDNDLCTHLAMHWLPPSARPDSIRLHHRTTPCPVDFAMVAEKDTISTGPAGITRYAFGLRTDEGTDYIVTLAGDRAAELFNATQTGDRVSLQILRGQVVLVSDGSRTVPTDANPDSLARDNELGLWITGMLCVLEVLALAIFAALRRRG